MHWGTGIPVYLIGSLIAEGESVENIIKDYPSLTREDIRAALHYAAKLRIEGIGLGLES